MWVFYKCTHHAEKNSGRIEKNMPTPINISKTIGIGSIVFALLGGGWTLWGEYVELRTQLRAAFATIQTTESRSRDNEKRTLVNERPMFPDTITFKIYVNDPPTTESTAQVPDVPASDDEEPEPQIPTIGIPQPDLDMYIQQQTQQFKK